MLCMVRLRNKNVPRPDRSDAVPAGTVPVPVLVLSLVIAVVVVIVVVVVVTAVVVNIDVEVAGVCSQQLQLKN